MTLIQVIIRLLSLTKMYIAFPKIVEQLINLMTEYSNQVIDKQIFETVAETTSESFGLIPFVPNEPGGFMLTKNILSNEWGIIELPAEIDFEKYQLYGRYGNTHSIRVLSREEIIAITMAKVSNDRIYTSNASDVLPEDKPRSIVYENIRNDSITVTTKNVNLTFFNCVQLNIIINEYPVGGIKMVKCRDCSIQISDCDKSPILPIYAFYCANCKIQLPHNYQGDVDQEIYECLNFRILWS